MDVFLEFFYRQISHDDLTTKPCFADDNVVPDDASQVLVIILLLFCLD